MSIKQARKNLKALFLVRRDRSRLKAALHDEPGLKPLLEKNHRLTVVKINTYNVVYQLNRSLFTRDALGTPECIREYDKASKDLLANHKELLSYLDTLFRQNIDNKHQKVVIHLERLKYLRAYKHVVKEKEALFMFSVGPYLIHPYSHEEFVVIQSHYLSEYEQLMRLSELPPTLRPTSLLGKARQFFFKPRTHDINSTPPPESQTESLPTYDEAEGHPEDLPAYS